MSRGALVRIFAMAQDMADHQHTTVLRHLDAMSSTDDPVSGGGTVTRTDHLVLLARDPDYQAEMLHRLMWATPQERAQLGRDLERAAALFPDAVPPSVGLPPQHPMAPPSVAPQSPEATNGGGPS